MATTSNGNIIFDTTTDLSHHNVLEQEWSKLISLLARASFIASRMGISMDEIISNHGINGQSILHIILFFDQMRLLIYYKSNDATTDTKNAVLKTFDLLSVKYRATGKAGLANKGGIVAEVQINKTPNSLPVHKSGDERIRLITGSTDCQTRVWSIETSNTNNLADAPASSSSSSTNNDDDPKKD
ncbi:hypothetical protein FRACYDRAFT_247530 [Fragilariopsis cylindrus CCMP1102]|uniref:Uncharacterized protein n=1 Tax=Fragilariopsis cylindrus CCMP1102 TaxID=635003 RepID=A0A1E7EWM2_9STRA|nr:hypothetical protein FRACYDRAFT_247530 [Fragilariopsis cylindrus CCMP1102]|eukprot:OEU10430.1 hypothetical protein FRACYDRAFT_247530 [Fragilariopsis cylindrus CCMP1102]